ncbi:hypothetical protein, partial [Streptomyces sp. NPDC053755]|uniref:hypothetical protein n=1 Tax=Streptomyces sp. NPDC053755 TaxID=3155815 RepID=UPI00344095A2
MRTAVRDQGDDIAVAVLGGGGPLDTAASYGRGAGPRAADPPPGPAPPVPARATRPGAPGPGPPGRPKPGFSGQERGHP